MAEQTVERPNWGENPQGSLGLVGELLSQPRYWSKWLSEDPTRSELLAETFGCVVRLEQQTGWPSTTLLRELGCQKRAAEELRDMRLDEVELCRNYFGWIEELVALVDRTAEQRRIVVGAARLFRDLHADLIACRGAMEAGDFTPIDFLRLGEIDRAWQVCRAQLGRTGQGARTSDPLSPGTDPHLRSKRIDRFLDGDSEAMSYAMHRRLARHIAVCPRCAQAVEERRAQRQEMADAGMDEVDSSGS